MKKILLSIGALAIAAVAVVGATSAILSDEETSTDNTFTAGAVDLTIDNESYYNGKFNEGTSWIRKDLEDGDFFFDFRDLKPGDWGEDTISLHVNNNDSWLCADVTLTENQDNSWTEPELNDEDPYTAGRGELGDKITFIAWADDGDNVLEDDENVYELGTLGDLRVGETVTAALADSNWNVWEEKSNTPLEGGETKYIGKAWCFGDLNLDASTYSQDNYGAGDDVNNGPDVRPIVCDGSQEDNSTQTDSLRADISFRAVQSRHNEDFVCQPETQPETGTLTVDKRVTFSDIILEVTVGDFELRVKGPNGYDEIYTDEIAESGLEPGEYTITETYVGDQSINFNAEFDLDCSDEGSSGKVVLNAGDNLTCRITNEVFPSI